MQKRFLQFAFLFLFLAPPSTPANTLSYLYDNLGRLTAVTYDNGIEIAYTYDALGNRTNKRVIIPPTLDTDGDGIFDLNDACPFIPNDAIGNPCDPDEDDDGTKDVSDVCPFLAVHDTIGNPCTTDDDTDGVADASDTCSDTPVGKIVNAEGCACSQMEMIFRDCAPDRCEEENWVIYPADGSDTCTDGVVTAHSCTPLSTTYNNDCDTDDDDDEILD